MGVVSGGASYYSMYWVESPTIIDPVKEFQRFITTYEPYTAGERVVHPQWIDKRTTVKHSYPKMEPRFPRTTHFE